ncbi:secondary thiamine-phosphate synthase enzyme YjbQ [Candidatus Methanomassiliicoccus intestinalis]|uniref:secondary thiamine-phosphate synthase enzyme YjbQ n=1 Tax=Candidatus Methanomassiliicoccus intestinalis TaxID=1406512 RepID=UPI0037DC5165
MSLQEFKLRTTAKEELIDITAQIAQMLKDEGIQEGFCLIHVPHTTAAVTVNENADPDVQHDLLLGLDRAFPDRGEFRHAEGNSAAHLKSSCLGCTQTLVITEGKLLLGTWQGIYFCEFDGPRSRKFYVKMIEG